MTASHARPDRHPQDWYVEQTWTVRALMQMVDFDRDATIWDPCCGLGTIPFAFSAAGFTAMGTDLVDRWLAWEPRHLFMGEHDFLGDQVHMLERMARLNIVANIPYGCAPGIAERFVRRALMLASELVCILVPLRWRACEGRYGFFQEYPPQLKLEFCDRPSMPPGTALAALDPKTKRPTAWKRGTIDYMWLVWDLRAPTRDTITRIIPPRTAAQKLIDRDFDLRRVGVLHKLEMAA
ncbi:hypothetical protein [Sphingobium yanoikuyae]|uniref:SAM-dependent methyltransferase n=1 Tax=Sphingobium yanoikuyae TaxID=13690 RepID=A0A430BWU8_SPHYA|nr:hypothetical protein [Sphingobium yanoikuyae]RSU57225.1 hypothetical protein DAH51_10455 [Sphingobium yanoikuyae]